MYKMYQKFAEIYDQMMSEIPYEEWFVNIQEQLQQRGKTRGVLCELGCGTGAMAGRFADAGWEVVGVDLSEEMLTEAQSRKKEEQNISYTCQDMRSFRLHTKADVVVCICDSANYLLEEQDLLDMFCKVSENMSEDGVFVMDMKTHYCYEEIIQNVTRVEEEDGYLAIWDNQYDLEEKLNEYILTIFVETENELYERYEEYHVQRAYEESLVEGLLKQAGFTQITILNSSFEAFDGEDTERVYYVAQR